VAEGKRQATGCTESTLSVSAYGNTQKWKEEIAEEFLAICGFEPEAGTFYASINAENWPRSDRLTLSASDR
jgi:hypothetical protein